MDVQNNVALFDFSPWRKGLVKDLISSNFDLIFLTEHKTDMLVPSFLQAHTTSTLWIGSPGQIVPTQFKLQNLEDDPQSLVERSV